MKRIAIAVLPVAAAFAMFNAFAAITVHSTYNENTGQWEGNFDELTNAVKSSGTWATINLEKGVYDLSPLTNAPMSTSTYQGPSLLALQVGTATMMSMENLSLIISMTRIVILLNNIQSKSVAFDN